jgi:hypothetical protein
MRGKNILPWILALVLVVTGFLSPTAWTRQHDPVASLQLFNRAALNGDLDKVQELLSRRFLRSTSFLDQKQRNPGRLKQEIKLLSFYQILQHEPLQASTFRVKVLQQRLVGRRGTVARWYYLVQEDNQWKVDRIGAEEPAR